MRENQVTPDPDGVLAVAVVISIGIGLSRVYLGYHWATDVVAGWTVAIVWLVIVLNAAALIRHRLDQRRDGPAPAAEGRPALTAVAAPAVASRLPGPCAMGEDAGVRFSINVPNFGDFADARTVARVAAAAEEAGWDGLFVWDHVVHSKERRRGQAFGDPWMLLTAAALATSRITVGPLVTPVARRRPEQLARQVATLDALSGGRVIFSAGLGGPIADEFGSFGDVTDPKVLAEKLDEGLDLLAAYWSGETVNHAGKHYRVDDVTLLPATVQRPRPPVWIAGYWPRKAPMRRAARWDGAVPLFQNANHGEAPPVDELRDLVGFLRDQGG